MIKAENGQLLINGNEMDITCEYSVITGHMLKEIFSTNRYNLDWVENSLPEERAAASFMANLDIALIYHSSLDREKFYDALLRLLIMRGYLKA